MPAGGAGWAAVPGGRAWGCPRPRGCGGGHGGVTITEAGQVPLVTSAGQVGVVVHILNATPVDGGQPATYCVPLTYHSAAVPELAAALLGELDTRDGTRWV